MEKRLSEITRSEWIAFDWLETAAGNDEERTFIRNFRRTPNEAAQARDDWDSTAEERNEAVEEE